MRHLRDLWFGALVLAVLGCVTREPAEDLTPPASAEALSHRAVRVALVGRWRSGSEAMSILASGRYAYVGIGNFGGMSILDISDVRNPVRISALKTPGPRAENCAVGERYLYVANDTSGLRIADISNPAKAREVAWVDTPGDATAVALKRGYAYVADFGKGLRVIDVSQPRFPHETAVLQVPLTAFDVAVSGDRAYVVYGRWPEPLPDETGGLLVVDIKDPTQPAIVGNCPIEGQPHALAISGRHAYVASWPHGLYVMEIADRSNPRQVGECRIGGQAFDVAIRGARAYVAALHGGTRVVDVKNPRQPCEIGGTKTSGKAFQVDLDRSGRYLYVAEGPAGVAIYALY